MSLTSHGVLVVGLWIHSGRHAVLVAPADACLTALRTTAAGLGASVELEDSNHRREAVRSDPEPNTVVLKYPQETGLPWVVGVASTDPGLEAGISVKRRNLVIGGLALVLR